VHRRRGAAKARGGRPTYPPTCAPARRGHPHRRRPRRTKKQQFTGMTAFRAPEVQGGRRPSVPADGSGDRPSWTTCDAATSAFAGRRRYVAFSWRHQTAATAVHKRMRSRFMPWYQVTLRSTTQRTVPSRGPVRLAAAGDVRSNSSGTDGFAVLVAGRGPVGVQLHRVGGRRHGSHGSSGAEADEARGLIRRHRVREGRRWSGAGGH
jgi:hypothetical protein